MGTTWALELEALSLLCSRAGGLDNRVSPNQSVVDPIRPDRLAGVSPARGRGSGVTPVRPAPPTISSQPAIHPPAPGRPLGPARTAGGTEAGSVARTMRSHIGGGSSRVDLVAPTPGAPSAQMMRPLIAHAARKGAPMRRTS
jgi:hypothetical protein